MIVTSAIKHLQITIPPHDYTFYMAQKMSKERAYVIEDSYWEKLPRYLIARCPLCGIPYTEKIDPHSLKAGWSTSHAYSGKVFFSDKFQESCKHRLVVQRFVNLCDQIPSELGGYTAQLHVPFMMPYFVPDDYMGFAVINSFVLCRLEDEQNRIYNFHVHAFEESSTDPLSMKKAKQRVPRKIEERAEIDTKALETAKYIPRYMAYAITYYSEKSPDLLKRRIRKEKSWGADDPSYEPMIMAQMESMRSVPHAYDLNYWVQKRKLWWIDLLSQDLPLKIEPIDDFPYGQVKDYSGGLKPYYY